MPSPYRRPSLSIDPTLTKDIREYGGKRLPTPGLQTSTPTLSAYETVKLGELATRKAGFSQNSCSTLSEKAKAIHVAQSIQGLNSTVNDNLEGIAPTTPMKTEFPACETEENTVPRSPKSLPENVNPPDRPKQRRRRTKLHEYMVLEAAFCKDPLPDGPTRERLGRELSMSPRAVQVWFQNRRQALKRKNELEMFHTGRSLDARYGRKLHGNSFVTAGRSGNDDCTQRYEYQTGWGYNEFDSSVSISNDEPGCACRDNLSANGVQQCLACLNLVNAVNKAFEGQAKSNVSRRETKRLNLDPDRRNLRGLIPIAPKGLSIGERRASRLGMRSQDLLASLTLASVAAQPHYPASASIAASIISPFHSHGIYNSPPSPGLPSLPLSPFVMSQFHPPAPCCSPDLATFPVTSRAEEFTQNSPNGNMICMHLPLTPGLSSAFEATHIGDQNSNSGAECLDSAALPTPAASPPKSDITIYYPGNGGHAHRRPAHRFEGNHTGFAPSVRSPLTMGLNRWAYPDAAVKTDHATVKDSALEALCETAAKQEYLPVPLPTLDVSPKLSGSPSNDMECDETSSPTSTGSDVETQELAGAVGQLWRPWD